MALNLNVGGQIELEVIEKPILIDGEWINWHFRNEKYNDQNPFKSIDGSKTFILNMSKDNPLLRFGSSALIRIKTKNIPQDISELDIEIYEKDLLFDDFVEKITAKRNKKGNLYTDIFWAPIKIKDKYFSKTGQESISKFVFKVIKRIVVGNKTYQLEKTFPQKDENIIKVKKTLFPLKKRKGNSSNGIIAIPSVNYHISQQSFGSNRSGGRKHGACDLYAPVNTKIYAMDDGVIKRFSNFYWQTYAIEVDHGDFVSRYSEVQPPLDHGYNEGVNNPPSSICKGLANGFVVGSRVKMGQHIGYVGQLRPINNSGNRYNFQHIMLHLEMYSKTITSGNLSLSGLNDPKNYKDVESKYRMYKFYRRKDLLDPTYFLDYALDDPDLYD